MPVDWTSSTAILEEMWKIHMDVLRQFDICVRKKETWRNFLDLRMLYREAIATAKEYYHLKGLDDTEDSNLEGDLNRTLSLVDEICLRPIGRMLAEYRNSIPEKKRRRQEASKACKQLRDRIFMRDHGICRICGRPVKTKEVSIDHIKPVILGGTDDIWNLQLAHRRCNSRKRSEYAKKM